MLIFWNWNPGNWVGKLNPPLLLPPQSACNKLIPKPIPFLGQCWHRHSDMLNRQTVAEVIRLLLTTVRLILTSRLSWSCCWCCCCCCCCWCCCSSDSRNMDSPASSSNTGSTGSLTSSIRPWKSTPSAVSNVGRARLWTSSRLLEAAAEEHHKQ